MNNLKIDCAFRIHGQGGRRGQIDIRSIGRITCRNGMHTHRQSDDAGNHKNEQRARRLFHVKLTSNQTEQITPAQNFSHMQKRTRDLAIATIPRHMHMAPRSAALASTRTKA